MLCSAGRWPSAIDGEAHVIPGAMVSPLDGGG
jgi:hypothetical protein